MIKNSIIIGYNHDLINNHDISEERHINGYTIIGDNVNTLKKEESTNTLFIGDNLIIKDWIDGKFCNLKSLMYNNVARHTKIFYDWNSNKTNHVFYTLDSLRNQKDNEIYNRTSYKENNDITHIVKEYDFKALPEFNFVTYGVNELTGLLDELFGLNQRRAEIINQIESYLNEHEN